MRQWPETPGERRCISCDQRLIADAGAMSESAASPGPETPAPVQSYVCPDDHERWAYDAQSRKWRQMY